MVLPQCQVEITRKRIPSLRLRMRMGTRDRLDSEGLACRSLHLLLNARQRRPANITDIRGWYVSGTYRVMKRLARGTYYSRYSITSVSGGPDSAYAPPNQTDTSLPANHIYDKVITTRVDFNRFWNAKVEGHFMSGFGASTFPDGFYPEVSPQGFKPNTNALVVKTGFNF